MGGGAHCSGRPSQRREGLRAELGPDADDLAEIVPSLALGDPPEVDVQVAPDTARFRLFDAVVRLCRLATADVPMVVVVDDIHVADLSSLLLLQFLAGHLDDMGLLSSRVTATLTPAPSGFAESSRSSFVNRTRRASGWAARRGRAWLSW